MFELANQYARLKHTKVIAYREHNDGITFVLASGSKLTFTRAELEREIVKLKDERALALSADEPSPLAAKTKKGKNKS